MKNYDLDKMTTFELASAIQKDDELRLIICENMEEHAGSFVQALAQCLRLADYQNKFILAKTFPQYIKMYAPNKWKEPEENSNEEELE